MYFCSLPIVNQGGKRVVLWNQKEKKQIKINVPRKGLNPLVVETGISQNKRLTAAKPLAKVIAAAL